MNVSRLRIRVDPGVARGVVQEGGVRHGLLLGAVHVGFVNGGGLNVEPFCRFFGQRDLGWSVFAVQVLDLGGRLSFFLFGNVLRFLARAEWQAAPQQAEARIQR